jgi:hypothetical protein
MNLAKNDGSTLSAYGLGDNDKTRPGVALVDWNDDDEATVSVSSVDLMAADSVPTAEPPADDGNESDDDVEEVEEVEVEELDDVDDIDINQFRPRWRGVGRRPGAVAMAVVLGLSFTIGAFAMFGSGEAQAETATASSLP